VYRLAALSGLIFIVYSLITMIALIVVGGQPESASEAFKLLEENKLLAFLRLDMLTLLIMPLYYPLFLGIFAALRKRHIGSAALGALLAFAGLTLFLATPSAFSWIPLFDKYKLASSAAEQAQLLAAGEALLASDMWHGSGAIIGGFLMLVAGLVLSVVMLKSENFSKWTAYVGILTYSLDLAHAILGLFAPNLGVIFMAIAGPLYLVWFPLLARDIFRLGRNVSEEE
jgi:hypothetical protein